MLTVSRRLLSGVGLLALTVRSYGREPDDRAPSEAPVNPDVQAVHPVDEHDMWNLPAGTLGGRQFWGDRLHFRGWRIQTNVLTGHSRLLDPEDRRQAWGTVEQCRKTLEGVKKSRGLKPMSGKGVVLIHGIIRSSHSFSAMREALVADGYEVVGFDYPSTQVSIEESSEYLHQTLESLDGIEEIDLVVHSMGGLVVRQYLSAHRDPRIRRMVMLGVPNHGANLANLLKNVRLFKTIYGPAGAQLCEGPDAYVSRLPTPDFPFGIIAGGKGTAAGFNPWIAGDDDGTVAVESTRLAGAADFLRVPALHTFMMRDPAVIAATKRFLASGVLAESGVANPIAKKPEEANNVGMGSLESANADDRPDQGPPRSPGFEPDGPSRPRCF
ncbi:alpha/beta fold hydrolase [Caulifigura coniformis]|nr:alpha/beta fold hydrolase [Caulifigura coniformis]